MKNDIIQHSMFQFDDEPNQPIPLQVAAKYHFPLQYHTTSDDAILYSVQDWISGIAKTDNPKRFDDDILKRAKKAGNQLYARRVKLPYAAKNGKTYQMDFADDVTLYVLAQQLSANTGIRNAVLDYLAKAGALVDLIRQDPETAQEKIVLGRQRKALKDDKSEAWITARELGIQARNHCTAAIMGANPQTNIGETTNITYKNVLGKDAAGLRHTLGLGPRENPRDNLPLVTLSYLQVAEAGIATALEKYADNDYVSVDDVRKVVAIVSKTTGIQAQEMAKIIGIDLVTGNKLLGDSK